MYILHVHLPQKYKISDLSVDGLKKDKPYDFRVRAKNAAGLGEPSATVGPITTKPKYSKSCTRMIQNAVLQ